MPWPTDDGTADLKVLIEAARTRRALAPPLTAQHVLAILTGALAVQPDLPEAELVNLLLHAGAGPGLWAQARGLLEGTATAPVRRFLNPGVNLKWLADYCGTSVEMIEDHYAGPLNHAAQVAQLALLSGGGAAGPERQAGRVA